MKTLTIFICLLVSTLSSAQQATVKFEPFFYDGKTFDWLRDSGKVLDQLKYDSRYVMLKIATLDGFSEFFQINDSIFYNRLYVQDSIVARGELLVVRNSTIPDTVVTFDPETYEENVSIIYACDLIKTNEWSETDSLGNVWFGNYKHGLKEDFWHSYNKNHNGISHRYENGKMIGISPTNQALTEQFFTQLFDRKYYWCSLSKYYLQGFPEDINEVWQLTTKESPNCQDLGIFQFSQNGTFHFKSNNSIAGRQTGIGLWKIKDDNKIQLQFKQSNPEVLEIEYIGLDEMRLKKYHD